MTTCLHGRQVGPAREHRQPREERLGPLAPAGRSSSRSAPRSVCWRSGRSRGAAGQQAELIAQPRRGSPAGTAAGPGPRPARWRAAGRRAGTQISAMARRVRRGRRAKPGRTAMARSTKRATASNWRRASPRSGGRLRRRAGRAAAPGTPARRRRAAATRLVASTRASGQPASAARRRAARRRSTCSKLSSTSRTCLPAQLLGAAGRASAARPAPACPAPARWSAATSAGSSMRAQRHEKDAVGEALGRLRRRAGARGGSCPCRPARSASAGAPARADAAPPPARARAPRSVVSWVGRLFGTASSVRSGGNSAGRPSITSSYRCSGRERSFSRCSPRSRRLTPVGQSRLAPARGSADETSTWPPCPAAAMRATRWTSMPT